MFSGRLGSGQLGSFELGSVGSDLTQVLSSALTLTQVATAGVLSGGAGNTLNLTSLARAVKPVAVDASSTLSLTDESETAAYFVSAAHTLLMTQSADRFGIATAIATSAIELTVTARSPTIDASETSPIELVDAVVVIRPWYLTVDSPLIEYLPVFDPVTVSLISTEIGLVDSASVTRITAYTASSIIPLTQNANGYVLHAAAIAADADNTLSLTSVGRISIVLSASNALALADTAAGVSGPLLRSDLSLADASSATVNRNLGTTTSLGLAHTVTFTLGRPGFECLYNPFIGSTTDPNAPAAPPATLPASSGIAGVKLRWPVGTPSETIELRAPNLGDIDRFAPNRINRETRGGTLVIFADPIWAKVETLLLSFSVLTRTEAHALIDFIEDHLGQDIEFVDWEGRMWNGVIVVPDDPVVEDRRNSYTASFEIEAVRV